MALADPLGLAAFFDLLRVADVKLTLAWSQQASMPGGGDTLYSDRAPPRWMAEITTVPMENAEAEGIMALVNSRAGGLKTFLLSNNKLLYPSTDPTGSIFGAATPVVGTITDRLTTAFSGFPNNYVMPLGTYFQIVHNSTRYYLGQFAEAKTASGAGAITATSIIPPLPPTVGPGDAVTVLKPAGKFKLTPGTAYASSINTKQSTIVFSAEQTLAA